MSDTNDEKDEIYRVNYNEFLKEMAKDLALGAIPVVGPFLIIHKCIKVIQGSRDSPKSKPTDIENLKSLIETGKEQELSKLEIELDKSIVAGIDLDVFSIFEGISVSSDFEGKNRILLKVEYK